MPLTQKHLDAVESAIARGEKTARYADCTLNPSVPVWAKPGSLRRIKNRQHWTTCRTAGGNVLDTICHNY
ncbi:hypothetical protein [Pseudomonas fragi]|uniref:hypothetical protein n=1 Tax=Pseudomonas fragi TaxID=296 RepID=UPI0026D43519